MDDFLKVQYFDELFEIFSNQREGWYSFYADYTHGKVHWSKEMVDFFGLTDYIMDADEALQEYINLIHPDDYDEYMENVKRMMDGETDELNMPYRIKNKNGVYTTVATYSRFKRDKEGKPIFYAGTVVNYEKNDHIEPTTGLYTTRQLMENMEDITDRRKMYFLMFFSIRDFDVINNKYGYITGNMVLRSVAEVVLAYKNDANAYRLEGTKFAILKEFDSAKDIAQNSMTNMFDNIRKQLLHGVRIDGKKLMIDIYGGAVYSEEKGISPDTVYTSALFALSKAKDNTDSTHLNIFNQSWLSADRKQLSVYNEIRESVMDGCKGFYLVYQPIVSKKTQKLVSMEALIRWAGEENGEVSPNAFIEWLERDSVFNDLGSWIIKKALSDARKIIEIMPDFIVNINLAYPQLEREDFEERLKEIVDESGVNPRNIRLELTERCKLLNINLLRKRMRYIQRLGIQTSLDDFGTGYSAINLMFDLPTNQIKIDKDFIANIEFEEAKRIMLKAIIDCARKLGAHVCIEGIENKIIADYIINNFNVTSLQGFYYSEPIPLSDFIKNMHKWM